MVSPADLPCRSYVYRKLLKLNANFEACGDWALAADFGDPEEELETAARLGLADLSPLPRVGFKGAGTIEWLAGQGVVAPDESNRAVWQPNGLLAARLAPSEMLLLSGLDRAAARIGELEAAWRAEGVPPAGPRGYPVPRQQSHFWFLVSGAQTSEMFAKICGVDLRPGKFPVGQIAQTSIARMNGVIIRDVLGDTLAYHVLGDSASAAFLWGCLLDAMAEYEGAPVGHAALKGLAGGAE